MKCSGKVNLNKGDGVFSLMSISSIFLFAVREYLGATTILLRFFQIEASSKKIRHSVNFLSSLTSRFTLKYRGVRQNEQFCFSFP